MKRKILLSAVLLTSGLGFAQKFESRTAFWAKADKAQQAKQALNKNASLNGNFERSMTASIGSGASNFYMVFKSEDGVEKDLMNFTFTCNQHAVTTHNINYHDEQKVEQKRRTGAIVKYGFDFPNAAGDKNFVTIADQPNDLTDVYEVIYVNDAFSELDHQQIQTYLSVKYGISLLNPANYTDANGRKIWNSNLNARYNNAITGLGRSDYFGLNKTETVNSVDKRLEIQTAGFENNDYLFVGTNNENVKFIRSNEGEILDGSWLLQTSSKAVPATLKFNLGIDLKTTGVYELILNPSSADFVNDASVVLAQGKIQGGQLVFEDVLLDADGNGYDTFSIGYSATAKPAVKPEIVNKSEINAYPNPTGVNEGVTVVYNFEKPVNLNIHVFTVDGKLVGKQEVNNTVNYRYDTRFSATGVYLVVSTYNGQVTTNRIIVK